MSTFSPFTAELAENIVSMAPGRADYFLVTAAKHGDHSAFAQLCEQSSPSLYRVIFRILKNEQDTQDVMQEAFLKAFRGLHKFDQRAAFSSWLTRIGINSAFTILRRRRRQREESVTGWSYEEKDWVDIDIMDKAPRQDELYIRNERTYKVRCAIGRLPESLRIVTDLRQTKGASEREIAERLNISLSAVKSRLVRARREMRRMLKEEKRFVS